MLKKIISCAGILTSAVSFSAHADTITFAIGEWEPYVGSKLEGYGPHSEVVAKTFRNAGFELKYEFMPWKRAYQKVKDGTFPISYPWYGTAERRKEVLVPARPVVESKTGAFYLKSQFPDGLTIASYKDIKTLGLTGISVRGYKAEERFTEAGVEYTTVGTDAGAWRMLVHKRGDIYTSDMKVYFTEAKAALGDNYTDIIGQAGIVDVDQMFPIFSPNHPDSKRLIAIWDTGEGDHN